MLISRWENTIEDSYIAQCYWDYILSAIKTNNREDILQQQNLSVLDLGGGAGEFSKNLNTKKGINCVSLDIQDLDVNPGANQIRGDIVVLFSIHLFLT
ncbi:MAG: hypothetical protein ABH808_02570 [Candidatus Kuenenbacteria bacterium]